MSLKNPVAGTALSQNKAVELTKTYREFKSLVVSQDHQISEKQVSKLKSTLQSIKEIRNKLKVNIEQGQKSATTLKGKAGEIEVVITSYEKKFGSISQQEDLRKEIKEHQANFVNSCKKRIELAENINYKLLKKLDVEERKSVANEVFKWILVCMYNQPETKYYWPNFKEQTLEEDNGEDLKARLARVSAVNAKQEQRVQTIKFINKFKQVITSSQLKSAQAQINTIFEIAKIFLKCSDIQRSIKTCQDKIHQGRLSTQKGDQENIQNKKNYSAINQRLSNAQSYVDTLKSMDQMLGKKEQLYSRQISNGEQYLKELAEIKDYTPITAVDNGKRDVCQCTIY